MKRIISIDYVELISAIDDYTTALSEFCPFIKNQLDIIDNVDSDVADAKPTLLQELIVTIQSLDCNFVGGVIQDHPEEFQETLDTIVENKEATIKDGLIFMTRSAKKPSNGHIEGLKQRRQSFFNTKFSDGHRLLRVNDIKTMTDLQFLFSLNGYYLPYCDCSKDRSMYEGFFSSFLRILIDKSGVDINDKHGTQSAYTYLILQECIPFLNIATELCINFVECLLEIITVINTRIKTAHLSINKKINLRTVDIPLLNHIITEFGNPQKLFNLFKSHKLTSSVNNERGALKESVDWTSKVDGYTEALRGALDIYIMNCDSYLARIKEFKSGRDVKIENFCAQAMIYILEFKNFLMMIKSRNNPYRKMINEGYKVLHTIDKMQARYPVKYGAKASPRSKSQNASPRTPKTPKTPESPGAVGWVMSILSPRK